MREGELRLEPAEGTLEGYGREQAVRVYPSSMKGPFQEPLLTIVSGGNGLRLLPIQVVELQQHLADWLGLG